MKPFPIATALLGLVSSALVSAAAEAPSHSRSAVLPADFKPPQVWKNANLVHIISLEKNYAKEQINVIIENVASEPQDEYYLPFNADQFSRIGAFEVKDRKDAAAGPFVAEAVEYDPLRFVSSSPRFPLYAVD
jgi:oligosaccharyltransferase complex subunit alpha (ribophorin I)